MRPYLVSISTCINLPGKIFPNKIPASSRMSLLFTLLGKIAKERYDRECAEVRIAELKAQKVEIIGDAFLQSYHERWIELNIRKQELDIEFNGLQIEYLNDAVKKMRAEVEN